MKWTLIVVVFGTMPVETGLIFNSLDDCLKAEEAMRAEYVRAYKDWTGGQKKGSGYQTTQAFMRNRIGLENRGTCIPHRGSAGAQERRSGDPISCKAEALQTSAT
jgi:hypothetical protein